MRSALFKRQGRVLRSSVIAALAAMTLTGYTPASPSVSAEQSLFAAPKPFRPATPEPEIAARLASAKTALTELASNNLDDVIRGRPYQTRALSIEYSIVRKLRVCRNSPYSGLVRSNENLAPPALHACAAIAELLL